MAEIRYHKEKFNRRDYKEFVLGGDIGGTHTNLAIAGVKNEKITVLFSMNFKSQEMKSLAPAIKETLQYARNNHKITIKKGCIAAAGPVSADRSFCKLTNASWSIKVKELLKKTDLTSLFLVNDFEGIGYGVNIIQKKDVSQIKKGKAVPNETIVTIGAGTGLGTGILVYNADAKAHFPIQSEGGHLRFSPLNEVELKFARFIKGKRKEPVEYEEVLSGRGISSIYRFLLSRNKPTKYTPEIKKAKYDAALISKYRQKDKLCREAFGLFLKFYARRASDLALDCLSLGGVYIAGGIAAKNISIFKGKEFKNEFEDLPSPGHKKFAKNLPVYIINNYDVSLYGACFAAMKRTDLAIK